MKILILMLFLILQSNLIWSQGDSCPTPPCYGNSCDCTQWSPWASKYETVVVPECPTCTLLVKACYRQCISDPTCVEIYIREWAAINPWCGNCDCLVEYLNTNDQNLLARRLRHLYISMFRILSIRWYNKFVRDLQEYGQDPPWCDLQQYRYKVFVYLGGCVATCYTQYPISDPNKRMLVTYHNCVSEYCCRRVLKFCTNRDGSTRMEEIIEEDNPVDCSTIEFPLSQCPPGQNVQVGPCTSYCTQD